MATKTHSLNDLQTPGINRRRLMKLGFLAGSALGFQLAFPALGHAATFVPVFGAARDIGVGSDGSVWVIGADPQPGGFGIYRLVGDAAWAKVRGGAVRVAVAPDGNAWVTTNQRQIYRFDGTSFQRVPGVAADIGVGADGTVWVIGADPQSGGFGIYRAVDGTEWTNVPGGAARIAVAPDGNAWVTNDLHQIYRFDGTSFELMPDAAVDVGIGADGSVWVIGAEAEPGGYSIYRWTGADFIKVQGGGLNIAVDPSGRAWVANSLHQIFRWV